MLLRAVLHNMLHQVEVLFHLYFDWVDGCKQ
jgi:hypothetical protein